MRDLFKSYWYYWYTNQRLVALISMILTAVLVGAGMVWAADFSLWGIVLAILMDAVGFWVALIYAFVLRNYLPQMFIDQVDGLIFYQFIIPVIAVFILGRLVTFSVAKFFAAQTQSPWLRQAALSVIAVSALSFGVGLWVYQEQQQAAAEAARLEAEANALSFAKIKLQAGELTEQAVKATQETAAQAVEEVRQLGEATATKAAELSTATGEAAIQVANKAGELTHSTVTSAGEVATSAKAVTGAAVDAACIKIAETLGKKPEDYCDTPAKPIADDVKQ